jgi:hypothetical protein
MSSIDALWSTYTILKKEIVNRMRRLQDKIDEHPNQSNKSFFKGSKFNPGKFKENSFYDENDLKSTYPNTNKGYTNLLEKIGFMNEFLKRVPEDIDVAKAKQQLSGVNAGLNRAGILRSGSFFVPKKNLDRDNKKQSSSCAAGNGRCVASHSNGSGHMSSLGYANLLGNNTTKNIPMTPDNLRSILMDIQILSQTKRVSEKFQEEFDEAIDLIDEMDNDEVDNTKLERIVILLNRLEKEVGLGEEPEQNKSVKANGYTFPNGYTEIQNNNGKYYVQYPNKSTSWYYPNNSLPAGWTRQKNKNGTYFFVSSTGKPQWEFPTVSENAAGEGSSGYGNAAGEGSSGYGNAAGEGSSGYGNAAGEVAREQIQNEIQNIKNNLAIKGKGRRKPQEILFRIQSLGILETQIKSIKGKTTKEDIENWKKQIKGLKNDIDTWLNPPKGGKRKTRKRTSKRRQTRKLK